MTISSQSSIIDRINNLRLIVGGKKVLAIKKVLAAIIATMIVALGILTLVLALTQSILLGLVFIAILVGGFLIPYLCVRPIFHPKRKHALITPSDVNITKWEDVQFVSSEGLRLTGWFIPPAPDGDGATLIFVHGLGGNRADLLNEAAALALHGYGALLIDLRNHGESDGRLTTLGFAEVNDIRGAVYYLLSRPEVNPKRIGLFGHSMGAATVLRAAARIPMVRAVIAQSAYANLEDNISEGIVAQTTLPPFPFAPLFVWFGEQITGLRLNQVCPVDDVARISPRAIMFIHGKQDGIVNVNNSLRLYEASKEPKSLYLIEGAGHVGLSSANPQEFERNIVGFLNAHLRD